MAALAVLKEEYPEGYPWGSGDSYTSPIMGAGIECAGLAYLFSDSIFSSTAPVSNVTRVDNLRIGDVVHINSAITKHWYVVTEIDDEYYSGADGNVDGKVSWTGWGRLSTLSNGLADGTITIYTRYPR